jgi:hypothetical protein
MDKRTLSKAITKTLRQMSDDNIGRDARLVYYMESWDMFSRGYPDIQNIKVSEFAEKLAANLEKPNNG